LSGHVADENDEKERMSDRLASEEENSIIARSFAPFAITDGIFSND